MLLINISAPLAKTDSDDAAPRRRVRKLFLIIFSRKFIGKHLCGILFLMNLQAFNLKETPARTFSCTFLQVLKKHVYLKKPLWMTTSVDLIQTYCD